FAQQFGATLSLGQDGQGQVILSAHADHRVEMSLVAPGSAEERMKFALDPEGIPQLTLGGAVMLSDGPNRDGFLMLRDHKGHSRVLTAENGQAEDSARSASPDSTVTWVYDEATTMKNTGAEQQAYAKRHLQGFGLTLVFDGKGHFAKTVAGG